MLRRGRNCRGFTLIELMMGLILFGILLSFAMPGFFAYLENAKLRAKSESILAGLQKARSEALRRNASVSFVLTADTPEDEMMAIGATLDGPNWVVAVEPAVVGEAFTVLDVQMGEESGASQGLNIIASAASRITFNALGQTVGMGAPLVINIESEKEDCVKDGGKARCFNVEVSTTGQVTMCDPFVDTPGDSRRCPSTP